MSEDRPARWPPSDGRPLRVLFLCTHNSARSQMSEGFLRRLGGPSFDVQSAGTTPRPIRLEAVQVMAEAGIDIRGQAPKDVASLLGVPFDLVVTVCDTAKESCPIFPGAPRSLHWSIEDPSTEAGDAPARRAAFRRARDELKHRIEAELIRRGPPP